MARIKRTNDTAADMARFMTDCAAVDGACTEEHLASVGFTRAEIDKYGETACAICRAAETRVTG